MAGLADTSNCDMDKRRFVQQYVERQRAYIPTYTTERPFDGRHGPLGDNEFGFDTPVLRPRVPARRVPQLTRQAGQTLRNHDLIPSDTQAPVQSNEDEGRKKTAAPVDTDDERAARLAGRRERKRKKRAIVNPPKKHDDDKGGRTNDQKAKKPGALALLYGFSATNVTKDRLTLKPAPSLGVFSKGRASAKKKITAVSKSCEHLIVMVENAALNDPASRKETFSEFAFLNKSSADHSKDADNDSTSFSDIPTRKATHITNRTKKDQGKCTEATALKTPQALARITAESEVWDIEMQSKLPSTVCDVVGEAGANGSAPVILDLRGAQWSASLDVAGQHEEGSKRSQINSPLLGRSDLHNDSGLPFAADAPSIHPSHSASQVGRCVADARPPNLHRVISRYFTESEPVAVQQLAARTSKSNDGGLDELNSRIPDQDVQDATLHVRSRFGVASPVNSLISVAQPMVEFQTRYDMVPLEFPSDCSPYKDWYASTDVPMEHQEIGGRGYFESSVVEMQGDQSIDGPESQQSFGWDLYRSCCALTGLAGDDEENETRLDSMEHVHDPLALDYEDDPEMLASDVERAEYSGEREPWFCMCEDVAHENDEGGVADFLEGRALLLLGVPEWPRRTGLSGLVEAEMDVASRLRDHWRPLRLS